MTTSDDRANRRERLRALRDRLTAQQSCSNSEAVAKIAAITNRSEWTVWAWLSEKEWTIPEDTLQLLAIKLNL